MALAGNVSAQFSFLECWNDRGKQVGRVMDVFLGTVVGIFCVPQQTHTGIPRTGMDSQQPRPCTMPSAVWRSTHSSVIWLQITKGSGRFLSASL